MTSSPFRPKDYSRIIDKIAELENEREDLRYEKDRTQFLSAAYFDLVDKIVMKSKLIKELRDVITIK